MHKLNLDCELVQREVPIGVRPALPVEGGWHHFGQQLCRQGRARATAAQRALQAAATQPRWSLFPLMTLLLAAALERERVRSVGRHTCVLCIWHWPEMNSTLSRKRLICLSDYSMNCTVTVRGGVSTFSPVQCKHMLELTEVLQSLQCVACLQSADDDKPHFTQFYSSWGTLCTTQTHFAVTNKVF